MRRKQLEVRRSAALSSLFHRFQSVSPFPLPYSTQTTMADAAEHDEELVDYDEEEVG